MTQNHENQQIQEHNWSKTQHTDPVLWQICLHKNFLVNACQRYKTSLISWGTGLILSFSYCMSFPEMLRKELARIGLLKKHSHHDYCESKTSEIILDLHNNADYLMSINSASPLFYGFFFLSWKYFPKYIKCSPFILWSVDQCLTSCWLVKLSGQLEEVVSIWQ